MKIRSIALVTACLLAGTAAEASVIYQFDFSNIRSGNTGQTYANFSVTLTYADYVTTTGMAALGGPPQATSLGYSVAYAGTNQIGLWGFDDDGSAVLTESGFTFNGRSFDFFISPALTQFIAAPGVYSGNMFGNAVVGGAFRGNGVLTVRDTRTEVPEPGALALVGAALAALAWTRRRAA